MRAVHERSSKRYLPAMAGYVALIMPYAWLVPRTQDTGLRALAMLPAVLAMGAFGAAVRDQDALERLLDPRALAAVLLCFFWTHGMARLVPVSRLR